MFKEAVTITGVREDKVTIKFTKREMCSGCKFSGFCGRGEEELVLDNPDSSLKAGDRIEVGIEEKKSLLAGLIIFLIPSLVFVAALTVFKNYPAGLSFFLAIAVLCLYYGIVKLLLRRKGEKFNLKIIRKI